MAPSVTSFVQSDPSCELKVQRGKVSMIHTFGRGCDEFNKIKLCSFHELVGHKHFLLSISSCRHCYAAVPED